jgi:hypothetical protein
MIDLLRPLARSTDTLIARTRSSVEEMLRLGLERLGLETHFTSVQFPEDRNKRVERPFLEIP